MKTNTLVLFFVLGITTNIALAQEDDEKHPFVSSEVCKDCHADIHNYWKNSMHAYSFTDPIFNTAYQKAIKLDDESRKRCLRCHAPVTVITHDYDAVRDITREGVTCDFCHTITAMSRESENFGYKFKLDRVRMGPSKKADSPLHESAYSELHTKSEFCAGCHEYTNKDGVKLLETYSEWKASRYASEGIQCQNCHMPLTEGLVVRPDVKETMMKINLHNLQGGHSVDKVKSATEVRIRDIQKFPGSVRISVDVTNKGSGHRIPTGTPSRELLLEVAILSVPENRLVEKKQTSFKKTLLGANGQILEGDAEIMVNARKMLSDNRLAPRETRTSRMTFVNVPPNPYRIRAKLFYNYLAESSPGQMQQMLIELASDEKALYIE